MSTKNAFSNRPQEDVDIKNLRPGLEFNQNSVSEFNVTANTFNSVTKNDNSQKAKDFTVSSNEETKESTKELSKTGISSSGSNIQKITTISTTVVGVLATGLIAAPIVNEITSALTGVTVLKAGFYWHEEVALVLEMDKSKISDEYSLEVGTFKKTFLELEDYITPYIREDKIDPDNPDIDYENVTTYIIYIYPGMDENENPDEVEPSFLEDDEVNVTIYGPNPLNNNVIYTATLKLATQEYVQIDGLNISYNSYFVEGGIFDYWLYLDSQAEPGKEYDFTDGFATLSDPKGNKIKATFSYNEEQGYFDCESFDLDAAFEKGSLVYSTEYYTFDLYLNVISYDTTTSNNEPEKVQTRVIHDTKIVL